MQIKGAENLRVVAVSESLKSAVYRKLLHQFLMVRGVRE